MNKEVSKKEYLLANAEMEKILIAGEKGGFDNLTKKQNEDLQKFTNIVKAWEDVNVIMPLPETLEGLIELKMFEKKLKQKELAKLLQTTDTQLSEILHKKRKPSVTFLKAIHQYLGIDGNLLLKLV